MTYSRMRMHTTIGAAAFHFRVRDGIGWCHSAIITRERVEGRFGPDLALALTLSEVDLQVIANRIGKEVANSLECRQRVVELRVSLKKLEVIWSSHTDH